MELSQYIDVLNKLGAIIYDSKFQGLVYSVGGCERDRLLGYEIKDIDLVVNLPDGGIRLAKWLYKNEYLVHAPVIYENYGTAMFRLSSCPDIELEAVQTRKESYRDMTTRNPETAYGTIQEDCMRRDFTMNALYRSVGTDELHDFTGRSLKDIDDKIIRSCDNPDIIFKEDSLRILRAIRFSCKLGWEIEHTTYLGMEKNVDRLEIISQERITDEFNKILSFKDPSKGLLEIWKIGAMKYVSSYLANISFEDFLDAVNSMKWIATEGKPLDRLAVLMMKVDDPEWAMREMKYSVNDIKYVMMLIREVPVIQGLGDTFDKIKKSDVRKLQYRIGDSRWLINAIGIAHSINNKACVLSRKNMQAMHVLAMCIKLLNNSEDCFGYKLPVDGIDVMEAKKIGPGKEVKKYLDYLLEQAFENPHITREECLDLIKKAEL